MTRSEANEVLKKVLRNVGDRVVYEAITIALKALTWEITHEKMRNCDAITTKNELSEET